MRKVLAVLVPILGGIGLIGQPMAAEAQAAPMQAAAASCGISLQALVDAAAPSATVNVPACLYREVVKVTKPITLAAQPGAEIRGSDVWTGWTKQGKHWTKGGLPSFSAHGECRSGSDRCKWPEQVFIDGKPLTQVASNPSGGQFSVSNGTVSLADDPTGHTVEVTMRPHWIDGKADGVTIQGFAMKHAGNSAQRGAISNNGHSKWTVQDNVLSDVHGPTVTFLGGANHKLLRNNLSGGGQIGAAILPHWSNNDRPRDVLVQGNTIHHNHTEEFDEGWEAGGLKAVEVSRLTLDGNDVYENAGAGLWVDCDSRDVVIKNNRVRDNANAGIFFEISDGAKIFGNRVSGNGLSYDDWGWGAGIVVSTSRNVEVYENKVAWNGDGIAVMEQDRGSGRSVENVYVRDNVIISTEKDYRYGLAWLSDRKQQRIHAPSANNRGERNAFWFGTPEHSTARFEWREATSQLAAFSATPGGQAARYLTDAETEQVLTAARIPLTPRAR